MIVCTSIAFALFLTFVIVYFAIHGSPESLSATYYEMNQRWIFPAVLGVCSALTIVPMFSVTPEDWRFLVFLFIAGALFVSASPAFREGLDKPVHYGSAIVMTVAALAWFAVMRVIPIFAIVFSITAIFNRKSWVFLCEIGLFLNLCIALFRFLL